MRIIITETKAYQYSELSGEAKQAVLEKMHDINVDYDWWNDTFDDAKIVGLEICHFDISSVEAKFIDSAGDTADKIMENHGETCETYGTAVNFIYNRDVIVDTAERDENGDFCDEWQVDNELDECEGEFLKSLCEDYRIILRKDYEYLSSEESIIETIDANGYEFTTEGKLILS